MAEDKTSDFIYRKRRLDCAGACLNNLTLVQEEKFVCSLCPKTVFSLVIETVFTLYFKDTLYLSYEDLSRQKELWRYYDDFCSWLHLNKNIYHTNLTIPVPSALVYTNLLGLEKTLVPALTTHSHITKKMKKNEENNRVKTKINNNVLRLVEAFFNHILTLIIHHDVYDILALIKTKGCIHFLLQTVPILPNLIDETDETDIGSGENKLSQYKDVNFIWSCTENIRRFINNKGFYPWPFVFRLPILQDYKLKKEPNGDRTILSQIKFNNPQNLILNYIISFLTYVDLIQASQVCWSLRKLLFRKSTDDSNKIKLHLPVLTTPELLLFDLVAKESISIIFFERVQIKCFSTLNHDISVLNCLTAVHTMSLTEQSSTETETLVKMALLGKNLPNFRHLYLKKLPLSSGTISTLAEGLQQIKRLSINECFVEESSQALLPNIFSNTNNSLEVFRMAKIDLTSNVMLKMINNLFGSSNSQLKIIELRQMGLKDEVMMKISEALSKNINLHSLQLCRNFITDVGCGYIVEALNNNSALQSLDLRYNTHTEAGVCTLEKFAKKSGIKIFFTQNTSNITDEKVINYYQCR